MLPFRLDNIATLPDYLFEWFPTVKKMVAVSPCKSGVGYLTVDQKFVKAGETPRRSGLHVDGVYLDGPGVWGGGPWGSIKDGMITISDKVGCRAWRGTFEGWPDSEGGCAHFAHLLGEPTIFEAGQMYWVGGLCIHESLPQPVDTFRTFVRLSMPSDAPWFEGYTVNPRVSPTGPIYSRRKFMDA